MDDKMLDLNYLRKLIQYSDIQYSEFFQRAREGKEYYNNDAQILKTGAAGIEEVNSFLSKLGKNPLHSANNKIPCNWHKVLTDQKVAYLFTYPPQFDAKGGGNKINKQIKSALGGTYEKVIKQLATDSSNCGSAWLQYWYGNQQPEQPKQPFTYWFIDPTQIRPIYDSTSVIRKIKYLVRQYSFVDETGQSKTRYEVWDDKQVAYLELLSATAEVPKPEIQYETLPNGNWNIKPHNYGRVPFIEFPNNEGRIGDLKMYKALIDSIDKLISGFANDIDDIQELVWNIKNYAGETSEVVYDKDGNEVKNEIDFRQKLKAKGVLFTDDKGGVDVIRSEIPFEARSKYLEVATKQLYVSAMAVNTSPDKTGDQSGVYIEFLYSLLELKAGLMQTEFMPALDELIKAILLYLGLPQDTEIGQTWTRNKPRNDTEESAIIAQTPNTVMSDETKTKVHPLVEDWQAERKQIEKETEQRQQDLMDSMESTPPTVPTEPTKPTEPNNGGNQNEN